MPKLLHIEASPRGARSRSTQAGTELVRRLLAHDPALQLDPLDLWREPLPELDGSLLDAKYATLAGSPLEDRQAEAWARATAMVRRLDAAHTIVISTPMWNFGIPYKLKHYIDLVTNPGLSFLFEPGVGYTPLLAPRPLYVVLASSGDYRDGLSYGRPDLATPYLKAALAFIGLTDPVFVPVGPTAGPPERIEEGLSRAREQIAALELA